MEDNAPFATRYRQYPLGSQAASARPFPEALRTTALNREAKAQRARQSGYLASA